MKIWRLQEQMEPCQISGTHLLVSDHHFKISQAFSTKVQESLKLSWDFCTDQFITTFQTQNGFSKKGFDLLIALKKIIQSIHWVQNSLSFYKKLPEHCVNFLIALKILNTRELPDTAVIVKEKY